MEQPDKKIKTSHFNNDDEAAVFLKQTGFLDPLWGTFPRDIWLKIISHYTDLTIADIEMMCRINSKFRELCKDKKLWENLLKVEVKNTLTMKMLKRVHLNDFTFKKKSIKNMVILNRILNSGKSYQFKLHAENDSYHEINIKTDNSYYRDVLVTVSRNFYVGQKGLLDFEELFKTGLVLKNIRQVCHRESFDVGSIEFENGNEVFHIYAPLEPLTVGETLESTTQLICLYIIDYLLFVSEQKWQYGSSKEAMLCSRIGCQNNMAVLCNDCETPYCSQECANVDWKTHKQFHFSL